MGINSLAQNITKVFAGNGIDANTKPNVLLKLKEDNTYDLQIFNANRDSWQFYNGDFNIVADTLFLDYKQLYVEPSCRIIDSFHRKRMVNFLYVDEHEKIIDTFTVEFSGNTLILDHFPLAYKNNEQANDIKGNIKYTWYVPEFKGEEMSIKFYKPARNLKDMLRIPLIIKEDAVIVTKEFGYFFKPFEKLKLQ